MQQKLQHTLLIPIFNAEHLNYRFTLLFNYDFVRLGESAAIDLAHEVSVSGPCCVSVLYWSKTPAQGRGFYFTSISGTFH